MRRRAIAVALAASSLAPVSVVLIAGSPELAIVSAGRGFSERAYAAVDELVEVESVGRLRLSGFREPLAA